MSALPVINPADFLPLPIAIEALDYEALVPAWKVQFKLLMLAVGLDYDVDSWRPTPASSSPKLMPSCGSRPGARQRRVPRAAAAAGAEEADLDGLAADRGVKRLTYRAGDRHDHSGRHGGRRLAAAADVARHADLGLGIALRGRIPRPHARPAELWPTRT